MPDEKLSFCSLCNLQHYGEECPQCAIKNWRADKNGGWIVAILLLPFAFIGFTVGLVFDGLKAGFLEASGAWSKSFAALRKPKPDMKVVAKKVEE